MNEDKSRLLPVGELYINTQDRKLQINIRSWLSDDDLREFKIDEHLINLANELKKQLRKANSEGTE